jgi:hypothetical protein
MLAGALLLLAAGALLLYLGIDWQRNGCGCDRSLYPGWSWLMLIALAAVSLIASAVLLYRVGRANR